MPDPDGQRPLGFGCDRRPPPRPDRQPRRGLGAQRRRGRGGAAARIHVGPHLADHQRLVLPGVRLGNTIPFSKLDEDYVVLVTADRIGDSYGWFGVRTYNSSWDGRRLWTTAGYPGDVGSGVIPHCQNTRWLDESALDFGGGRAISTDADTFGGQSGSGVWAWWNEGPPIVAVVSAEGSANWCSGGNDLTRLVNTARQGSP